jgi:hypothetical protein
MKSPWDFYRKAGEQRGKLSFSRWFFIFSMKVYHADSLPHSAENMRVM